MPPQRIRLFPWNRQPTERAGEGRTPLTAPEPPRKGGVPSFGFRLKFERKGLNVHITLESDADRRKAAAEAPLPAKGPAPAAADDSAAVLRMQTELRILLHRHPDARKVLRALARFERLLRQGGSRAFEAPPTDLLKLALAQLECIESRWEQPDLVALRARLTLELTNRQALAEGATGAPLRSDFLDERRLSVSEASASDFAKAQAGWPDTGVTPG